MSNKKIALIILLFVTGMLIIIGFIGISSHIPFVGRGLSLFFAVILIIFIITIFVLISRRRGK